MTGQTAPSTRPGTGRVPAHPLDGRADRAWRIALLVLGALLVLVTAGALAGLEATSALARAAAPAAATRTSLGRPAQVAVRVDAGDVRVVTSADAHEASLVMQCDAGARATVSVSTAGDRVEVHVSPPATPISLPWDPSCSSAQIVLPSDLAASMHVSVHASTGGVSVEPGEFGELAVVADVGDVTVRGACTAGDVRAMSSTGDVDLSLDGAAVPSRVEARTDTGDVRVAVPGSAVYAVDATAGTGDASVAPGIASPGGPPLTARTDVGTVTVAR